MARNRFALMVVTALVVISLTVVAAVFLRSQSLPGCSTRVGEICVVGQGLRSIEISRQIHAERYVFSFRDASGQADELVVVRDNSLGDVESELGAGTTWVETRMWNGTKSSSYFISGAAPGVTVKICVESLLRMRCVESGTVTRLTQYRG